MAIQDEPVPFVVGAPRSGTTLLRAMLASHSSLAIPQESHFVPHALADERLRTSNGRDLYVRALEHEPRFQAWGLDLSAVQAALDSANPADVPGYIRATFTAYAASQNKPRWGDKTPRYSMSVTPISAAFPDARFVHIIRDPRACVASYLKGPIGPDDSRSGADTWAMYANAARNAGRQLGAAGRYIEVRYEDLVTSPTATLTGLCEWLRLDFEEPMLEYYRAAPDMVRGAQHPSAHQSVSQPLNRDLVASGSSLSATDRRRVERSLGGNLERFGYDRSADGRPWLSADRITHLIRSKTRGARYRPTKVWAALTKALAA